VIHDLPEDQKANYKRIGEEVSEQLEYEAASIYVIRHIRYKYAPADEMMLDASGESLGVIVAQKPATAIDKGIAGPGLLAQIAISKFGDHRVQGKAVFEMRVGLSWPGERTWPQTTVSCTGQEPLW